MRLTSCSVLTAAFLVSSTLMFSTTSYALTTTTTTTTTSSTIRTTTTTVSVSSTTTATTTSTTTTVSQCPVPEESSSAAACSVPCVMAASPALAAASPVIIPDPRNRKAEMCQDQCEIDFPSGNVFDDQEDEKNACLDACGDFRCDLTSCDAATGTSSGTRNNLGTNCRTMTGEEREGCLSACENACGPNPYPPC